MTATILTALALWLIVSVSAGLLIGRGVRALRGAER